MGPHSIVYEADGEIHKIGPCESEETLLAAGKRAQADGQFDIRDQRAYHLYPDHRMVELTLSDLGIHPPHWGT